MTVAEIIEELKSMGTESTKNTFMKHGAKEPFYGVKVGDMKKIQKKVKKNHDIATGLYDSGISDAMYLAGLVADESKMTKQQIDDWAHKATWYMISEYTVPWVAADSQWGWELGLEWIDSPEPKVASCGWSTLSSWVMVTQDEQLDTKALKALLKRVEKEIHNAPNRVRYTMNGFVIALGSAVASLTEDAIATAKKVGTVMVDMGGTACKTPDAQQYIKKVVDKGYIGKKRKTAKC